MAFPAIQASAVTCRVHGGDQTGAHYAHPDQPGKVPGAMLEASQDIPGEAP